MKTYELITIKDPDGDYQTLKATQGEQILWIPTDPNNSDYAEYLRYTAWVEAGNDPDEFWAQENLSGGEI
jgi:hypothetical protein